MRCSRWQIQFPGARLLTPFIISLAAPLLSLRAGSVSDNGYPKGLVALIMGAVSTAQVMIDLRLSLTGLYYSSSVLSNIFPSHRLRWRNSQRSFGDPRLIHITTVFKERKVSQKLAGKSWLQRVWDIPRTAMMIHSMPICLSWTTIVLVSSIFVAQSNLVLDLAVLLVSIHTYFTFLALNHFLSFCSFSAFPFPWAT